MSDSSFNAFKLHHHSLTTTTTTATAAAAPNSTLNSPSAPPKIIPFCICTHCTNLISLNHHLGDEGGSTRRGLHGQSQQSSRWSPTPAQLLVLEELYRQGTKTPTAEQIQQIASQLRRFGKIEGKNVFYWFQNHKARERQKRRRREMEEAAHSDSAEDKDQQYVNGGTSEEKQDAAGLRATGYEVKETKKWASTSNCSGLAEEPVSLLEIAESGPNGWTKLEDRSGTQVLKGNTFITTSTSRTKSFPQNLTSQNHNLPFILNTENCNYCDEEDEEYANTRRTLELFPLKRDDQDGIFLNQRKSRFYASTSLGTEITSAQFFEFLPSKD